MTLPRRVVLHVGMPKAGSTAIQNFFDREYDALVDQGILFPRSILTRKDPTDPSRTSGHFELVRLLRSGETGGFLPEIAAHGDRIHTLVLSAENLFHPADPGDLARLAGLLDGREIELVALLRAQSDWVLSRHYESVVKGFLREIRPVDAFVRDALGSGDLDYRARLDGLEAALHPARTHVLNYDAISREKTLISRFAAIAGFASDRTRAADAVAVNASEPYPEAIEAHRQLNLVARSLGTADYRAWCAEMRAHYRALAGRGVLAAGYVLPGRPVRAALAEAVAEVDRALSARDFASAPFGPDAAWTEAPDAPLQSALVGEIFHFGGRRITKRLRVAQKLERADRKRRGVAPAKAPRPLFRFARSDEEAAALSAEYADARVILEYGAGSSTALASGMPGKYVQSVEHDAARALDLQLHLDTAELASPAVVYPVLPASGVEPGEGFCQRYALAIWDEPFFRHPDVILIAGPFRTACFAAAVMRIDRPVTVFFEDYAGRPQDHGIEALARPAALIGRMARFDLVPRALAKETLRLAVGAFAQTLPGADAPPARPAA